MFWDWREPAGRGRYAWPGDAAPTVIRVAGGGAFCYACTQLYLPALEVTMRSLPKFLLILTLSVLVLAACAQAEPTATPAPTDSPIPAIEWETSTVLFSAQAVEIDIDGTVFVPPSASPTLEVQSDPGDAEYTTLEVEWFEDGREMRLYIYFYADASRWWSDEIRTYDGQADAEWVYYEGRFFDRPLGSAFEGSLELSSTTDSGLPATLTLTDLRLEAFRQLE